MSETRRLRCRCYLPCLIFLAAALCSAAALAQSPQSSVVAVDVIRIRYEGKPATLARPGDILIVVEPGQKELVLQSSSGIKARVDARSVVPFREAARLYTDLIRARPRDASLYWLRAQVWAARGDDQRAIADCTAAIELGLNRPEVYYNRGIFYASSGRAESAIADYSRALKLDANYTEARANRAAAYLAAREYDKAVGDYSVLIDDEPQNVQFYVQRAIARRLQQDFEKALADFNAALQLKPDHIAALEGRGFVHYLKGDHEKAVADFDRLVQLQPKNAMAYNNRAYNRQMISDYSAALEDYNASLELAPNYAMAYQNKAWLLATCPEQSIRNGAEAFAAARKACELRDYQVPADLKALAAAYAESADFKHAVEYQQKVVAMSQGEARKVEEEILKLYQAKEPYRTAAANGEDEAARE